MNKETQDLAWKCLPKEAREEIKKLFNKADTTDNFTAMGVFIEIFGHHNLTSDEEPSELLFVERKKVIEEHKCHMNSNEYGLGYTDALEDLFGDKCQSDEELREVIFVKPEPSVQGEPKFKVGDKVLCKVHEMDIESLCIVSSYNPRAKEYKLLTGNSNIAYMKEEYLKPYIDKPKFKVGDEIIVVYGNCKGFKGIIKKYSEDDDTWAVILDGYNYPINFAEEWIEPYIEPSNVPDNETMNEIKDNMEEKELNLCELLKGYEEEEFYSLMHGKVRFMTISADGFVMFDLPESFSVYDNGKYDLNAEVIIYPSRALYEKYPLDAYSAWMEWKLERTPKWWRANIGGIFWRINVIGDVIVANEYNTDIDNDCYNFGNYFRTKEEAKQAAKAVRECLIKFHETK